MCSCDICGDEIYPGNDYYRMPDGLVVCEANINCMFIWMDKYKEVAEDD